MSQQVEEEKADPGKKFEMCFALFDGSLRAEMFMLLELSQVRNYTHFIGLHGSSAEGKKEDSVAWPGSNEILLMVMNLEEKARFSEQVQRFREQRETPPGLLTISWQIKDLF